MNQQRSRRFRTSKEAQIHANEAAKLEKENGFFIYYFPKSNL